MENLDRLILAVMDYAPLSAVDLTRGLSIEYEKQITTSQAVSMLLNLAERGYVRVIPATDELPDQYEKLHELNT